MAETKAFPVPTVELIHEYKRNFDAQNHLAEAAIFLAVERFPMSDDVLEILIKVAVINSLYSTHVHALPAVASHIQGLQIDTALSQGDAALVDRIARVDVQGKVTRY